MMAGVIAVTGLCSCNDAVSPALPNSIYLADAVDRDEFECLVKPMREATYNVTVKMTHKVDHDIKLRVIVDHDLLQKHYEVYGEDITLLPTENWVLYDTDGTPHAGEIMELTFPANQTTAVLPVKIFALENGTESQYALPLTISEVSEDIHLLENLRSQLFVFQAPFETPVMFMAKNSQTAVTFARAGQGTFDGFTTKNWTLEFHFHIDRGGDNNMYGCPMIILGPSEVYVRQYTKTSGGGMDIHFLGDLAMGYHQSNFGYPSDYYYNMAYQGQWNHLAIVCNRGLITEYLNGQEVRSISSAKYDTDWTFRSLSFYSQENAADIGYSEVRLWSVARTDKQLSRFKYEVNPNTKGLEAYFRCNEPDDSILKDSSHNGLDWDISDRSSKNRNQITWGRARTNDDFTSFVTVE